MSKIIHLLAILSILFYSLLLDYRILNVQSSGIELVNKALSSTNLLLNSDFEGGNNLPFEWSPDAWASGCIFEWESDQVYQGNKSIQISATIANDARWIQTVSVQPYADYRLSGWIKTENVFSEDFIKVGANLSLYGTWSHTGDLIGTNDWTFVEMTFNSGSSNQITIAARLGYWASTTTGTAWFDDIHLEPISPPIQPSNSIYLPMIQKSLSINSPTPSWRILALVYESTDFYYLDASGVQHHLVSQITQTEKYNIERALNRFVYTDIPALNSGNMYPTVTIRYPSHALTSLSPQGCNDFAPDPIDVKADRDAGFDSIITIWNGDGIDLTNGVYLKTTGCAWTWPMGTGQTYVAIPLTMVSTTNQNVFKHEWGHSILFYYDATGVAPKPAVDNHINDTTNQYVNCLTGQPYMLEDETDENPIPNSIYNNATGFTHDYYSGQTVAVDELSRCLGITPNAWASGGPVTKVISSETRQGIPGKLSGVWIGEPVP